MVAGNLRFPGKINGREAVLFIQPLGRFFFRGGYSLFTVFPFGPGP